MRWPMGWTAGGAAMSIMSKEEILQSAIDRFEKMKQDPNVVTVDLHVDYGSDELRLHQGARQFQLNETCTWIKIKGGVIDRVV
jgi:hypothetical protein